MRGLFRMVKAVLELSLLLIGLYSAMHIPENSTVEVPTRAILVLAFGLMILLVGR